MLSKFIFVWLLCLTAVFVQLPSASSIVWPKFHEKKKPIDQIVATIDACTLSFLGVFEGIRTSSVLVFATNSIGGVFY
jgi:hypothetical protein